MKNRLLLLICIGILLSINLYATENLGMFVQVKRYFDQSKNTRYDIDYQVPYKNLMFNSRDHGYFAELLVSLSIANTDSVLYKKEFINNIGVSNKYDITNTNKSFLDRISLTLAKSGYFLQIQFTDLSTDKTYTWNYLTEQLNSTDILSDIELISSINSDTTAFSKKFMRLGKIFVPEPSGIISKDIYDSVFFYCEVWGDYTKTTEAVLTLKKENLTYQIRSLPIEDISLNNLLLFPVYVRDMQTGKYDVSIGLDDERAEMIANRTSLFILTEQTEKLIFLLEDADEEFLLIRNLASIKSMKNWNTMSKEAKRRYITNFWTEMAATRNQSIEAVLKTYNDRLNYCNARFSHFEKGWKSDMGRIYLRNGPPSDIETDTSSDETRFVRKDYQIWKYYGAFKAVYVFVDIPMNGNYKLIYSKNDEQESTFPDWRKYLGTDFDESRLEN